MKIERLNEEDYDVIFEDEQEEEDFSEICTDLAMDLIFTALKSSKNRRIGQPVRLDNKIEKVKFNDPATIVFWKDGTKTVSKCREGDKFSKETGLAMCIIRKLCGNRNYNKVFEKFCK